MANQEQSSDRRAQQSSNKHADDAFWLQDTYPDANELFGYKPAAIGEIVAQSFVALDANVLLWPYELNSASLAEIDRVYGELQSAGRLVVPAQAAREFYKHRTRKLAALSEQIEGAITRAKKHPLQSAIPLLQDDDDYKAAQKLAKEMVASGRKMIEKLELVKTRLQTDIGNDPVSAVYRNRLADVVAELMDSSRSDILSEVERRARLRIAPGYKDANKEDGGVGDYLVWRTVLQQAEDRKTHCLFVTNEEKSDWWVKSGGAFQPRPELLDEYRRASGGKSLHVLPLSELLSRFAAEKAVVEGVQALEEASRNRSSLSDLARMVTEGKVVSSLEYQRGSDYRKQLEIQRSELASLLGALNKELDDVEEGLARGMSDAARSELLLIRNRTEIKRRNVVERLAQNAKAIIACTQSSHELGLWEEHLSKALHRESGLREGA